MVYKQHSKNMLSDIQKTYIEMILLSGQTNPDDVRVFLAKSGWGINDIDSAISYINTNKNKESQQQEQNLDISPKVDLQSGVVKSEDDTLHVEVKNIPTEETNKVTINSGNFEAITMPLGKTSTEPLSTPTIKSSLDGIAPIVTMPQKEHIQHKETHYLKWIAVALFVVLLLVLAGGFGYMYYTKTGLFANLTYIKK